MNEGKDEFSATCEIEKEVREENGLERDDFREYEQKWVGTWKQLRSRKICRV